MSEQWQEDEASLRSYEREQADLERQTDALVLKTLTSLVSAAEDLKARLRRDTDSLLEEYRRTRRGLENEISMAGAERQRLRDEAESERDRVVSEARTEAEQIVREAQQERESLLGDVRESQQRLRALEAQILQVLGAARGGVTTAEPFDAEAGSTAPPAGQTAPPAGQTAPPAGQSMPAGQSVPGAAGVAPGVTPTPSPSLSMPSLGTPSLGTAALGAAALGAAALGAAAVGAVRGSSAGAATPDPSVDVDDDAAASDFEVDTVASDFEVDTPRLGEPEPADRLDATTSTPFDGSPSEPALLADPAEMTTASTAPRPTEVLGDDEPELSFAPSEPAATAQPATPVLPTRTDEAVELPTTATAPPPAPTIAPATEPAPMGTSAAGAAVPAATGAGAADAVEDTTDGTAPRGLQLVFDGVPGYQQAAAIERAVGDLVDDGEVEIIEFEQGQLVLQVEAANPRALADRLIAKPPLPMRLVASGQDSATFQLTAG